MKRFSRSVIILNICLCLLIACLLVYSALYNGRESANAALVQDMYEGVGERIAIPLRVGANPNTYFDPAAKQAIPEPDTLHRWLARLSGNSQPVFGERAPVLSLAITYGRKEEVEVLLAGPWKTNVNAPDGKDSTPLQYAALHNERDILITLLDHHADVNHQNSDGDTALHIATTQRDAVNMQILLDHGANPNLVNRERQTPLDMVGDMAEDLHREWIVKYGESRFGEKKPGESRNLPEKLTQHYRHQLELLRPLITVLEKNGAKPSAETQSRLAGSYDLNPREVEQALTAPDPTDKSEKQAH